MKRVIGIAIMCAAACSRTGPPVGHVLLFIDTDAPLPKNAAGVAPLFDRVRMEVFRAGESTPCPTCVNELDMDELLLRAKNASIQIVPPPNTVGTRVRVRLFLSRFVDPSGEPIPDGTLETVVELPAVGMQGAIEATAVLRVASLGASAGTIDRPIPPILGAPDGTLAGTWVGARKVKCSGASQEQVCIEGGAFWMGDPHLAVTDERAPRLVVLSPFWIDVDEVTVAQFRAGAPAPLYSWSGGTTGNSGDDFCTWASMPVPEREVLAMECVTWAEARDYCIGKSGALPSEAQLERAFGPDRFPWGLDVPDCSGAIFGRGGVGITSLTDDECNMAHLYALAGPQKSSSDSIDVTAAGVRNLGGNVSEWALDFHQAWNEPCWSSIQVYSDPICTTPSPTLGIVHPSRAGNWTSIPAELGRARRAPYPPARVSPTVGFRCARSG